LLIDSGSEFANSIFVLSDRVTSHEFINSLTLILSSKLDISSGFLTSALFDYSVHLQRSNNFAFSNSIAFSSEFDSSNLLVSTSFVHSGIFPFSFFSIQTKKLVRSSFSDSTRFAFSESALSTDKVGASELLWASTIVLGSDVRFELSMLLEKSNELDLTRVFIVSPLLSRSSSVPLSQLEITDVLGLTDVFVLSSPQHEGDSGAWSSFIRNAAIIAATCVVLLVVTVLLFLWRRRNRMSDRGNLDDDAEAEFQDEGERLFNSEYSFDVAFGLQLYSIDGLANQSDLFDHDAEESLLRFIA
jgi:hypothetical protein